MMKKYLFALRKSSYSGLYVQEMIDIILTTAAFEQDVTILLLDDAVFHLKNDQNAINSAYKNTAMLFSILPTMDVDAIFVETQSLLEHGLSADMLTLPVQEVSREDITPFMSQFDIVFAG
jgi:tRNA 2-thiouridine synthesizing protein C